VLGGVEEEVAAVDGEKVMRHRDTQQAERNRVEQIPSSPRTYEDTGPDSHDRGHASQFDPVIDKERKLISNLRWNMPVLSRQFQICG
jgi:hypothetical protein